MPGLHALHRREQLRSQRDVKLRAFGDRWILEGNQRVLDHRPVAFDLRHVCGLAQQHQALGHLPAQVMLRSLHLAPQLIAPGAEPVGPGLNRVCPRPRLLDLEASGPTDAVEMGVDRTHLSLTPKAAFPMRTTHLPRVVQNDRAQQIVAIAEDVGLHHDAVPHAALGGEPPAVNRWRRVLDHDPLGRFLGHAFKVAGAVRRDREAPCGRWLPTLSTATG